MIINLHKIKQWIRTIIEFFLNPRLLLCLGLAWVITNGWAYITLSIAAALKIGWLAAVAGAYLAVLWVPFTPEKIITVIIGIFFLKKLFPNDQKTLQKLYLFKQSVKKKKEKIEKSIRNKRDTSQNL